VNAVDDPPVISSAISDLTVDEDAADTIINLTNVFTDIDSGIVKTVENNSNKNLISATINNNDLVLDYQADENGSATIVIKGSSNGKNITDTFTVTVNEVDDEPIVSNAIADITVNEGDENTTIDLSNVFSDVDNKDSEIKKIIQI